MTDQQIQAIEECADIFIIQVDLTDFKVMVGLPSRDEATGVIGYVGLYITADSVPEYNRAVAVYGGKVSLGHTPHVSICGWDLKDYDTTTDARAAVGLVTEDRVLYPDGGKWYIANVFPSMKPRAVDDLRTSRVQGQAHVADLSLIHI